MVSQLIKEKIGESLKNFDIVNLTVANQVSGLVFSYKGFFIDFDENFISFFDVIKEKTIIAIENIREIITIQKGGAKFVPVWELLQKK